MSSGSGLCLLWKACICASGDLRSLQAAQSCTYKTIARMYCTASLSRAMADVSTQLAASPAVHLTRVCT